VFFRFWGSFWGDFGDFGTRNRHFFSFFGVTSPLRAGVGVFGSAPHLLNVSGLGTAHFVRRTQHRLVQRFINIKLLSAQTTIHVIEGIM
jgi:hypothetical protein